MTDILPWAIGGISLFGAVALVMRVRRDVVESNVAARVEFRNGRAVCTRGVVLPRILGALSDCRSRQGIAWTSIEHLKGGAVRVQGTTDATELQKIRNVFLA